MGDEAPPYRRRYGIIRRPSGRGVPGGFDRMDWSIDGGEDAPLTRHDGLILAGWAAALLVVSIVVAAVATYLW